MSARTVVPVVSEVLVLSEEVEDLKNSEKGVMAVCDVMRHYENIAREQEKISIARKLLQNGLEPELIAAATGLTPDQLKELGAFSDKSES